MIDPQLSSRRPKTPTQERGERRVADLQRAAEQLFAEIGYAATTMSGIAQLAGASIGSLYQFFPSKESIGSALLRGYMDDLNAQLGLWKSSLPETPRALGQQLITLVFDYVSARPTCQVLADTPSLVPQSYGMEKLSISVQDLLSSFAPSVDKAELSAIALAASFMVRAAVQGSRVLDAERGAALRQQMQHALGGYLEERLRLAAEAAAAAAAGKMPR
jgi:AcrR family transcriptional regulator